MTTQKTKARTKTKHKKLYVSYAFVLAIPSSTPLTTLTLREYESLAHFANGLCKKETAERMHVSCKTVEKYRSSLSSKLKLDNLIKLTHFALHYGVVKNMYSHLPSEVQILNTTKKRSKLHV